jgi:UTP:GlnB (protein PII) uridylyltransferase
MPLPIPLTPADQALSAFLRSMPPAYAAVFGTDDVRQHLKIVSARGTARAHAAAWQIPSGELTAVCIVADDQPGLLSLIATALVMHRMDVSGAQIFCRERPGGHREAVNFFWLRRSTGSGMTPTIADRDLSHVAQTLSDLLVARPGAPHPEPAPRPSAPVPLFIQPRVFFDVRALRQGEYVLVVQALDGPGLLLAITRALIGRGVEIVASEVRTEDGIAKDRFTLASPDCLPLTPDSLAAVQRTVLKAVRELRTH